jgi:hypothetical protein
VAATTSLSSWRVSPKAVLERRCAPQAFNRRQTYIAEELFDKARVAQFVSVTGDANILHADSDDEGSPVQGETSECIAC